MSDDVPDHCEHFGCRRAVERYCVLCTRHFCARHDELPRGHACLSDLSDVYNALRVLEPDEQIAALERFRPLR